MNIKLFIVMGASWLIEIISTAFGSETSDFAIIWFILNSLNLLHGFFIFVIFVCKQKVARAFQTRLGKFSALNSYRNFKKQTLQIENHKKAFISSGRSSGESNFYRTSAYSSTRFTSSVSNKDRIAMKPIER